LSTLPLFTSTKFVTIWWQRGLENSEVNLEGGHVELYK
jgi:hypothetical protein